MPGLPIAWDESWLWLGGSLFAAILWANLAWVFRSPRPGSIGKFVARLSSYRFSPWLFQFLRLLYYVGVPFAALTWRSVLVGRYLGLSSGMPSAWTNWARDVGWAAALGAGAWVLLALGRWAYRRALAPVGEGGAVAGAVAPGWAFLFEAVCHEVHWAFYRSVPIVALGGDTYWGAWVGLGLVALEAALNPAWRQGLLDPKKAPAQLMRAALAVVSSTLFVLTGDGNLWLALALHWGVSWGLAVLVRAISPLPARTTDQSRTQVPLD